MRAVTLCGVLSVCVINGGCSQEAAKRRHFANGERLLAAGKVNEAIVEFRNASDRDEFWGEARYKLAEAYAQNGEAERAYRQYIRAADLMPDNLPAQLKAATYLLIAGQYEDARTRVERVLEKHPDNVDAQIILGNALAGLKDLDGAVTQVNDAIQLEPGRSQAYTNLAIIRVAQGRQDEARAAFEKAVQTDPASAAAWLALANFQWSTGADAAAEQSLDKAFAIDKENVLAHRALAAFYIATGRSAEAEPHLKFVAEKSASLVSQLALADYYIALGRFADAKVVLEPLALGDATSASAETRLAGITYVSGQTADAHRQLDAILRRAPDNAPALLLKARWLLAEGQLEQALESAKSAVAAEPRTVAAHYIRGLAELRSHRSSDAINSFTAVLRLNPRAAIAQVQLSRLHLARNAVDSAVLFAEEALRNAPDSLDARLALSRAWIARDDLKRAQAELNVLKTQAPGVAAVHALDGSLQLILGNTTTARAAFERALQIDADSFEALNGLTTIDVVGGQVALARGRMETILKVRGNDPDLLALAAKVFIASGDPGKAVDALRRAIELDPLNLETFPLLARLYADQQRLDAVRAEFDAIAQREPTRLAPKMMSAIIVHAQGDVAQAQKRYAEVLHIEPRAALAANNLAAIYVQQHENLDRAQQLAETASDQFPSHAEIQDTLGLVYYQRELYGRAVLQFKRSVEAAPGNPMYQYHLGLAYQKNGEYDHARGALKRALTLDPKFGDAQHALASLPG